ncbi:hypothetical protein BGZ72_005703 [Mortierella alpina]|nr:hypothetical protein BGZ72_005703 [Mortierella alpina]
MDDQDQAEELVNAMVEALDECSGHGNPNPEVLLQLIGGGAVANGSRIETSVHPAWRDALMNVMFVSNWENDLSKSEQQVVARKLTSTIQILRDITPGSGAYLNEADPGEPDWQYSFFGSNYPRLKKIKDMVDPQGLFLCNKCVGSEDWSDDLTCRRSR